MKKIIIFILCLSIALITSSCDNCVGQDTIIYNSLNKTFSYNKFKNCVSSGLNMDSFSEEFDVKYYKSFEQWLYGTLYYTVIGTDEGMFQVVFKNDGKLLTYLKIKFSDSDNEDEIRNIEIGMSLKEVRNADPDGAYPFLYHNASTYPQSSHHYFENGNYYCFEYEDSIVTHIVEYTI